MSASKRPIPLLTQAGYICEHASVQRGLSQRLGALLVVAVWTVPAAGAMALSLHVALDHHHQGEAGEHTAADLLAAAHGHRHPEVVPAHEHSATFAEAPSCLEAAPGLAPIAVQSIRTARTPDVLRLIDSRASPPERLFSTNCSLRL